MIVSLCTQCNKKLAISPEGLCNICDEEALQKRVEDINNKTSITALEILEQNNLDPADFQSDLQ